MTDDRHGKLTHSLTGALDRRWVVAPSPDVAITGAATAASLCSWLMTSRRARALSSASAGRHAEVVQTSSDGEGRPPLSPHPVAASWRRPPAAPAWSDAGAGLPSVYGTSGISLVESVAGAGEIGSKRGRCSADSREEEGTGENI